MTAVVLVHSPLVGPATCAPLADELADLSVRRSVLAELSRLPLAMFTDPAPEVPGWPDALCGYLRLSSGYDRYLAEARSLGWRTASLDVRHLSLCGGEPVPVANAMLGLLDPSTEPIR